MGKRIRFCVFLLFCAGATLAKPNVLLVVIDNLNDWIGCIGGHPQAQTPNIDRLARRGVLFSNAQCQSPVCNPSRTSLMSGLYPERDEQTTDYRVAAWAGERLAV